MSAPTVAVGATRTSAPVSSVADLAYHPSLRDRMRVRPRRKTLARMRGAVEPEGRSLLDLGGGTGATTVVFGEGAREIVVLEPNEKKVARGKAANAPVAFVSGVAESIPFESGQFDRVTSHLSFHHFSDPERSCREARRVLVDGGRFVIFDLRRGSPMVRWFSLFAGPSHHAPARFPTPTELERLLRSVGFRKVVHEELGPGILTVATR